MVPGTFRRSFRMKKQTVLSALIVALLTGTEMLTVIGCMGVPMSAPPPPASTPQPSAPRQPTPAPPPPAPLPAYDVTYSYGKPDDLAEALQDINDYLEDQGGYLIGNEQQGEFIIGGQSEGYYQVTGDTVTVSFNVGPGIFIIKEEFSFHFDKPRNMSEAVRKVDEEIRKNNGTLTGTNLERQGSFSAKGVVGSYTVTDRINVTITERPLVTKKYVEDELIKWFNKNT